MRSWLWNLMPRQVKCNTFLHPNDVLIFFMTFWWGFSKIGWEWLKVIMILKDSSFNSIFRWWYHYYNNKFILVQKVATYVHLKFPFKNQHITLFLMFVWMYSIKVRIQIPVGHEQKKFLEMCNFNILRRHIRVKSA